MKHMANAIVTASLLAGGIYSSLVGHGAGAILTGFAVVCALMTIGKK